mmetsp:Transcript_9797/g.32790  ORF Transcript_9797/g.32790 Transcript_9797/m.32790 type:complete len:206 (+) Transcript_9797:1692-2309(+)
MLRAASSRQRNAESAHKKLDESSPGAREEEAEKDRLDVFIQQRTIWIQLVVLRILVGLEGLPLGIRPVVFLLHPGLKPSLNFLVLLLHHPRSVLLGLLLLDDLRADGKHRMLGNRLTVDLIAALTTQHTPALHTGDNRLDPCADLAELNVLPLPALCLARVLAIPLRRLVVGIATCLPVLSVPLLLHVFLVGPELLCPTLLMRKL